MATIDPLWLLENATYGLMLLLLLAAGMGLPIPEDVILLVAGALLHRGTIHIVPTAVVAVVGVLAGDLIIFLTARHLGTRALERPLFKRLLPDSRRQELERLFNRWGGGIVFAARHVAGLRAPVFALAGLHGVRPSVFLLFDTAGLMISAPLFLGLGYLFSDRLELALTHVTRVQHVIIVVVALALVAFVIHVILRRWVYGKRKP